MASLENTNPMLSTAKTAGSRLKIWHLGLLVAFVALAIVDIQNHRRTEPVLIGLAAFGFAAYAVLAWLGWSVAQVE